MGIGPDESYLSTGPPVSLRHFAAIWQPTIPTSSRDILCASVRLRERCIRCMYMQISHIIVNTYSNMCMYVCIYIYIYVYMYIYAYIHTHMHIHIINNMCIYIYIYTHHTIPYHTIPYHTIPYHSIA